MKNKSGIRTIWVGSISAMLATAIWSGNFIIARGLSDEITPVSLAFLRWSVAVVVFFPLAIKNVIADMSIIMKHIPYLLVTSILGVTLFNTLIYFAGRSTTAVNLSVISITFPVYIIIISRVFLKEEITLRKIFGIILVFTGAVFLITKGNFTNILSLKYSTGDLWMFLSAIIFAVYSVLLKFRPKELGLWSFQLCTFVIGLTILVPFFLIERGLNPPIQFSHNIIISILYAGIFASLVAFLLWNKAISTIGPVKSSMVYYLLPVFSSTLAFLLLREKIYNYHLISLCIIVAGILIANLERKRDQRKESVYVKRTHFKKS